MMKRKMPVVCIWILAIVMMVSIAYGEDDPVTCAIELSPEYLPGPGEVNVTITISNTTDKDLQDPVILFSPQADVVSDFGNGGSAILKAGESQTWTGVYNINERELDQGFIQYFAKYTMYKENGQASPRSQAIRATVSRQEAEVAIDVDRTITPSSAHEGQEIQVKYTITNAGTVALKDVTITENGDINSKAQTIPKLDAGAKVELTYKATMEKKDLTSSATITYKADGSTKEETYTVEEKKIPFAQTNLSANLSSSAKGVVAGGTLTLKLELKNKGSEAMTDIRVTDPVLGDVFTNQKVEAGKTLTLEKDITLTESGEYQFTINAIDATGTEVSTVSNALSVTAMNPEDALHLTLTAVPDRTEVYSDPAGVRFTVTVSNDSKVDAANVKISHGYVDLYTFDSIKAGESRTLSRDTVLSTSGKFQFTATAQDPLENESSFQSNEMQIAVYEPTPVPATPTPPPVPTAEPTFVPVTWAPIHHESVGTIPKTVQKILLPALIVAGILLVASSVLLLVAGKRRMDNKKASEAAFDHLERARRRDYTVGNPDEMAAASKATLSHNHPQDSDEFYVPSDENWDMPAVDAMPHEEGTDGSLEESFSSFGQGFFGDIGDEGFEASHQPMNGFADDVDFNEPDSFRPDAFQPGDLSDDDLFKFDSSETSGDEQMSNAPQGGFAEPYDGFGAYPADTFESVEAYEPMEAYESARETEAEPFDAYMPADHASGEDQSRSRRSRK